MNPVRTIGHSNHPIERFVDLLRAGGVEVLVDVRSTPWSRRFPQFGKEGLAKTLAEAGIAYVHEGAALGGKPEAGGSYDDLARRPDFAQALDRVTARAAGATLCLMCAEKEPLDCHRTVLVSRRLAERGAGLFPLDPAGATRPHPGHLLCRRASVGRGDTAGGHGHGRLADGGTRPHAEIEDALLGKGSAPDLFDDRATRLARAYAERERAMRRT